MRIVPIHITLTEGQVTALTMIRRGEVKGFGWPDCVENSMAEALINLGLISHRGEVTTAGNLVVQSTGNESVVTQ